MAADAAQAGGAGHGPPLQRDGRGHGPAAAQASKLMRWTGAVDLYRPGVFSTQRTWRWCTAAVVQIMRNIDRREVDRSRTSQQRYFAYMRAHDRYAIPLADGVDPAGWTAGLRRWVDPGYRVVATDSFRSRPPVRRDEPANVRAAGRDHGRPRRARLGAHRVHGDRRPGRDEPIPRHERPRGRARCGASRAARSATT